ncbi:hypothetical protein GRZ55_11315 [Chelativorans sp. ZYF759]|uniref:hypothetical protein n=1 Tax=Chelativorans sp. ZYF759 TaxID=2692213 RepID=UPI001693F4A3|nr:hypothetical protein [Chelativorans sp. ZYF759]NMG39833.1 hypothetical protein [Chelativorans sp. ZYF759]
MNVPPRVDAFDPAMVDFDVFALFLEARRIHRRKTVRRVARESGIEPDAVQRAARGRNPGAYEFFALCDWIGEQPTLFLRDASRAVPQASPAGTPAGRATRPDARSGLRASGGGHAQ